MQTAYHKIYSHFLQREMESKVYGFGGMPVLFIPCQDGRFFDFENFKMTDVWQEYIDSGRVQVFTVDTIDTESWSSKDWDKHARMARYEAWIQYIVQEALPYFRSIGAQGSFMTFGCSLGAAHAANLFFRFPDEFRAVLALSGLYSTREYFGDYMDELIYLNSPTDYIGGMRPDHPYLEKYARSRMIFCVGQGAWEEITAEETRRLQAVCEAHGIPAWFDYWGTDVNHDWDWWYRMVPYFLPKILEDN